MSEPEWTYAHSMPSTEIAGTMIVPNSVYLIGSLRNPEIPYIANQLRDEGFYVFDDWHAGGEEADDEWQRYEKIRGRSYTEALWGEHARNVFEFDKYHLDRSAMAVLVMPAGKSAHLELGYMAGSGKKTFVLFEEEPERFDVMYRFTDGVFFNLNALVRELEAHKI